MKINVYFIVFLFSHSILLSQDSVSWVNQLQNVDNANYSHFRTQRVLVDSESNYYLYGKSEAVAISNDTLNTPESLFNVRHYVSKITKSGEVKWIKDTELQWLRSWITLDSKDNFHCLKQRPGIFNSEINSFDIVYNKFDTDWNLIDSFKLVKFDSTVESDYFLSFEIFDEFLYAAFSVKPHSGKYLEIEGNQYSIETDSLEGEYIFLIKYNLETRQLSWINKLYSDEFRNVQIKSSPNGEVYLTTNYIRYVSLGDDEIQFSTNNCGNCPELLISMFEKEGDLKWKRTITESFQKEVKDILELNGHLYLVADLNALDLTFDNFTISGINTILLLCINDDGNFINAKSISFADEQVVNSIEASDNGHIILAGNYIGEGLTEIEEILESTTDFNRNSFLYFLTDDFESIKSVGIFGGPTPPEVLTNSSRNLISDIQFNDGKVAISGNFTSNSIILDTTIVQSNFEFSNVYNGYLALVDIQIDSSQSVSTSELGEIEFPTEYFKLVPNPTTSTFSINCANEEIVDVKIFDVLGNIVVHKINWNTSLDFESLRTHGIYYVLIKHKNYFQTKMIVVN